VFEWLKLMAHVQMATLYLHTSINLLLFIIYYLLLKVDSKSFADHILDGDKSTDTCGDDACGDGACGDGACGDGACGDGICRDDVCGDDVDNGENDEGRINVEEKEVFAMVVVFFTFFFDM